MLGDRTTQMTQLRRVLNYLVKQLFIRLSIPNNYAKIRVAIYSAKQYSKIEYVLVRITSSFKKITHILSKITWNS